MHHAKTRVKGESRINKRRFSINLNRHSSRCSFTSVCIILNFDNLNETRSKMNHYIYTRNIFNRLFTSLKKIREEQYYYLIGAWWKVEGILNEKDENESWRILSEGWILLCIRFISFIVPRITLLSPLTLASSSFRHSFQDPRLGSNQATRLNRKKRETRILDSHIRAHVDPSIRMNPGMEIEGEGSIEVNYDLDGRLVLSYSKKKK